MGLGQAVSILVGQRLGADRPDLAERSAYTGLKWVFGYMCGVAAVYLLFPGRARRHRSRATATRRVSRRWPRSSPTLLACVAVYSLADAVNVTFSFALRGAGDTRFVSLLTFALAWPIMVVPTFVVVRRGRQHLRGLGLRDGVHHRHGRLLLPAVPDREVEEHAGDRGARRLLFLRGSNPSRSRLLLLEERQEVNR